MSSLYLRLTILN
uniref:Uncharacterized protein n=1 Tax=Anguilla anguilla TaxID=7936 RepID=A0A0E9T948_ANGAN